MKKVAILLVLAVLLVGFKWSEEGGKAGANQQTNAKANKTIKNLTAGKPEEVRARMESLKRLTSAMEAKRKAQKK